jgi:hypothetical protein
MNVRKLMIAAVAMAALALPSLSHAQVTLGLRAGFAPATGDAFDGGKMSDGVKSQVPIQVDALYAVMPNLKLGGYFSYGFGQVASDLGNDVSSKNMRFGVEGIYQLKPMGKITPWAGVGIGYEIATLEQGSDSVTSSGFEFANLQLGGDYKVTEKVGVGPFVMVSVGQYSKVMDETTGFDKAVHEWLQFGIRGTFDL